MQYSRRPPRSVQYTSPLGPVSKSSVSPKSGERLLTFASKYKSFEFHVKAEKVCKMAFVSGPERRVARFLGEDGGPLCSLILDDKSDKAGEWLRGTGARSSCDGWGGR